MKRWSRFLQLRRQYDVIKVICLFAAIGVFFLADMILNGIFLYRDLGSSMEFIIESQTHGAAAETGIEELRRLEHVKAVSRQCVVPVSIKYRANEAAFSCVELSEAYLNAAYGIVESQAMKTFYVNQTAYDRLTRDLTEQQKDQTRGRLRVSYALEGDKDKSTAFTVDRAEAIVILISEGLPEEDAIVLCRRTGAYLTEDVQQFRVLCDRQELTGGQLRRIQELGFTLCDMQDLKEAEYRRGLYSAKIRYGGAAAVVSLTGACVLTDVFCKKYRNELINKR